MHLNTINNYLYCQSLISQQTQVEVGEDVSLWFLCSALVDIRGQYSCVSHTYYKSPIDSYEP